jgi:hypothetical protein
MGIVSDEDFEKEINKVTKAEIIPLPEKGRGNGNKEVPESLRKIIGETNELDSRTEALALARMFDISDSSVSAYSNGATSTTTYNQPNPDLKNHIDNTRERIQKKARGRLFDALKHITEEKLASANVKAVSGVARDMAAIIKDMEPEKGSNESDKQKPQFVFYAPQFRDERSFDVIHVKE